MLLSTCRQKLSKMIWNWHEIIQFVCRFYEQLKVFKRQENRRDNSNSMTTTLVSVRIDSLTCITSHCKAIAYFPFATTTTNVKINLSVLLPIWRSSLKNRRHLTTLQLVFPRNDVCVTSAEIPYGWRHYPDLGSERHQSEGISAVIARWRYFFMASWNIDCFFFQAPWERDFSFSKKNPVILRDFCKECSLKELTPISALVSRKRRLLL